jgi:DNA-binding MarR family transcriptional regulator
MNARVPDLLAMFMNILHTYSIIEKKPKDYGIGIKLTLSEVQLLTRIGEHPGINLTSLADTMGVTRGAISQMVQKLSSKKLVLKEKVRNNKEYSLTLTDTGKQVYANNQATRDEIFTFAQALYDQASPHDRETVRRLFAAIQSNLKERLTK